MQLRTGTKHSGANARVSHWSLTLEHHIGAPPWSPKVEHHIGVNIGAPPWDPNGLDIGDPNGPAQFENLTAERPHGETSLEHRIAHKGTPLEAQTRISHWQPTLESHTEVLH